MLACFLRFNFLIHCYHHFLPPLPFLHSPQKTTVMVLPNSPASLPIPVQMSEAGEQRTRTHADRPFSEFMSTSFTWAQLLHFSGPFVLPLSSLPTLPAPSASFSWLISLPILLGMREASHSSHCPIYLPPPSLFPSCCNLLNCQCYCPFQGHCVSTFLSSVFL